jgi:hypothetical protein
MVLISRAFPELQKPLRRCQLANQLFKGLGDYRSIRPLVLSIITLYRGGKLAPVFSPAEADRLFTAEITGKFNRGLYAESGLNTASVWCDFLKNYGLVVGNNRQYLKQPGLEKTERKEAAADLQQAYRKLQIAQDWLCYHATEVEALFQRQIADEAPQSYRASMLQLRDHQRGSFTMDAPEIITKIMGLAGGVAELQENFNSWTRLWKQVSDPDNYQPDLVRLARINRLQHNPLDLLHLSLEYLSLQLSLKALQAPLQGKNILQLACNFGQYLHFLKQKEGMNVFGVDIAAAAVQYARANGLNVLNASAAALPFKAGTFNFVVSNNFLCPSYMSMVTAGRGGRRGDRTGPAPGRLFSVQSGIYSGSGTYLDQDQALFRFGPGTI